MKAAGANILGEGRAMNGIGMAIRCGDADCIEAGIGAGDINSSLRAGLGAGNGDHKASGARLSWLDAAGANIVGAGRANDGIGMARNSGEVSNSSAGIGAGAISRSLDAGLGAGKGDHEASGAGPCWVDAAGANIVGVGRASNGVGMARRCGDANCANDGIGAAFPDRSLRDGPGAGNGNSCE